MRPLWRGISAVSARMAGAFVACVMSASFGLAGTAHGSELTRAEERVCKRLDDCLSIVDRHSHNSFDYRVLGAEFARFGETGEKSLTRMIERGGAGAGHAADLLAQIGGASILDILSGLQSPNDAEVQHLSQRTYAAISARLSAANVARPKTLSKRFASAVNQGPIPCRFGEPAALAMKRRQMPFFESQVAQPDAYGAWRPSAKYDAPYASTGRANLNSAVPIGTGWLAAYDGGLMFYDGNTGRPTALSDMTTITVQPWSHPSSGERTKNVWAIMSDDTHTVIMDATPPAPLIKARLPGAVGHVRRIANGDIAVSTRQNLTVRLRPDGTVTNGCAAPAPLAQTPAQKTP